ncbi:MAG: prevent-host-death protein [Candidatus Competibacteraceae bacterium]
MKVFTYSEARQNLSKLLVLAQQEEIEIRRKDGSVFSLREKRSESKSPFDVPGVNTEATTSDILDAIRESRER